MDTSHLLGADAAAHVKQAKLSLEEKEEIRKSYDKKMRGYGGFILLLFQFAVICCIFAGFQTIASVGFIVCIAVGSLNFALACILSGFAAVETRPPEDIMKSIVLHGVLIIPTHVQKNFEFYYYCSISVFAPTFITAAISSFYLSESEDASVGFIVCMTLTALGLFLLCIISFLYYFSPGLESGDGNKA
jgi:hypothetical protein